MLRKLGDNFLIVGVAHVLPKSMVEIRDVILAERPEIVAVELCPARYLALLQGGAQDTVENLRAGMRQSPLNVAMYLAQAKFSHQTGMPAGEEMLGAIETAREIGARVELVDQDIGVTVRRLSKAVPFGEKARIFAQLLLSLFPFQKRQSLESLADEDVVDYLLWEFRSMSPKAYNVLIQERDAYMAARLVHLLESGRKVVCAVGAGHVPGIYKLLQEATTGWGVKLEYGVS